MKKLLTGLAVASMAIAGFAGSASAAPSFDDDSVYDEIQELDGLYARILAAAGLDKAPINLGDCDANAQYTVFLPVIPAIVALVEEFFEVDFDDEAEFAVAVDALLADKATLVGLLKLHVHGGTLTSELLFTDGYTTIPTAGGLNLSKTVGDSVDALDPTQDESIFINGFEIVASLPLSCNGAIHLLGGIITPPTAPQAPACGATYAGTGQCPAGTGTAGSGSGLPATGSESMALTYAALASLIAGAGVLVLRRRSVA